MSNNETMTETETAALNDAMSAIQTLSWHAREDDAGESLGEDELFSKSDRERMKLF